MAFIVWRRLGIRRALRNYRKEKAGQSLLYQSSVLWHCNFAPLVGRREKREFGQSTKTRFLLCLWQWAPKSQKVGFWCFWGFFSPSCLPGQCLEALQRKGKALWMLQNTRWWARLQHPRPRCDRDTGWKRCGWGWEAPSSRQLHGVHGNLLPAFSVGTPKSICWSENASETRRRAQFPLSRSYYGNGKKLRVTWRQTFPKTTDNDMKPRGSFRPTQRFQEILSFYVQGILAASKRSWRAQFQPEYKVFKILTFLLGSKLGWSGASSPIKSGRMYFLTSVLSRWNAMKGSWNTDIGTGWRKTIVQVAAKEMYFMISWTQQKATLLMELAEPDLTATNLTAFFTPQMIIWSWILCIVSYLDAVKCRSPRNMGSLPSYFWIWKFHTPLNLKIYHLNHIFLCLYFAFTFLPQAPYPEMKVWVGRRARY